MGFLNRVLKQVLKSRKTAIISLWFGLVVDVTVLLYFTGGAPIFGALSFACLVVMVANTDKVQRMKETAEEILAA